MLKIKVLEFNCNRAYTIEKSVNCLLEEMQKQNGYSLIKTKYFSDARGCID